MFFGTQATVGVKDWNSLADIVSIADPTVTSTGGLGNIPVSGNTWWQSYVESTSAALTTAQMTTAFNTVSKGNDKPDFVITTQTLFEKYESLLAPALRYTDTNAADAGFENLMFKTAPVMFDAHCNSGVMYFLNSKYLGLVGHKDVWFKNRGWTFPDNIDARYLLLLTYGNMTCRNRARQGKLTAKTA